MLTTRDETTVPDSAAAITSTPRDDKYVPAAVHAATQALLRVESSDQARQVLVQLVRNLGGHAVPKSLGDVDALPIDISLREGEPVYPTASKGSAAHWLLAEYIEAAVTDARVAIELVRAAERLATDAGIDRISGLPDHQTMSRLLSRLVEGDAIVAMDLDWIQVIGTDQPSDQEILRSFGRSLRLAARATEHCGRFGGGEFLLLMYEPGEEGCIRLLERLRERWEKSGHSNELSFSAGIANVDEQGWRSAIQAADRALRRAQETGDKWETATPDDY